MKNTRVVSLIMIFIALFLITTGTTISFIEDFRVDAQETSYLNSSISTNYGIFNLKAEEIKTRFEHSKILVKQYYQDIYTDNKANNLEIKSLENAIKDVTNLGDILIEQCGRVGTYDSRITQKCDIIRKNYETIQNAFVSLVENHNQNIKSYNEWTKTDMGENYPQLKQYDSNTFKYVDLDGDGEYLGKLL